MRTRHTVVSTLALFAACAAPRPAPVPRAVFVEGEAGRLAVQDFGGLEPAVVLLHGLGGDADVWRAQVADLCGRQGRHVVVYDQRGHGRSSPARDGVYTVDALAVDLDLVIRELGLHRVVLVGHSFSGTVLTAYASAHPETVVGLVYLDAVGDFSALPQDQIAPMLARDAGLDVAGRRAAFAEMLEPRARPRTREQVLVTLDRLDPPAFAALRRSMAAFPGRKRYARYHGPAVAIEAAGNEFPATASRALGVPRVEIAGVSHWLMLDDPEATNAALDAFLRRVAR
ncbi:MAG TPA: alpha/beta hydrolase [Anaeromyxobacteraceae bacterium]|nr:alpha/beta hydrolase [Anaeromyxobacteraceae bacterium]